MYVLTAAAVLLAAVASAVPFHDATLSPVVALFANYSSTPAVLAAGAVPPGATALLTIGTAAWVPPSMVSVPVAATTACLAFNLASGVTVAGLRGEAVADLIMGRSGSLVDNGGVALHAFSSMRVAAAQSPTTASVATGIGAGSLAAFFADATRNNSRFVELSNDTAVADYVMATPDAVGVLPLPLSTQRRLPCLTLRSTTGAATTPRLSQSTLDDLAVSVAPPAVAAAGGVYPFLLPLVLHVDTTLDASAGATVIDVLLAFGQDTTDAALARWGLSQLPKYDFTRALSTVLSAAPALPLPAVPAAGSSAIKPVAGAWSREYTQQQRVLIDYESTGSGTGRARSIAHQTAFSASDALFSSADRAANPGIRFVPAVAFAVSVAHTASEAEIVLPPCTIMKMFTGRITRWDDAEIVRENPGTFLPAAAVEVVVRSDKSGTTEVFTTGLALLERRCLGVSTFNASSVWPLANNVTGAAKTGGVVAALNAAPFRMAYVSSSTNVGAASFATNPTLETVSAALTTATVDDATFAITFNPSERSYAFVGTTYFLFHQHTSTAVTNLTCAQVASGLDFMRWALVDPRARAIATQQGYVPLPDDYVQRALSIIDAATCDGVRFAPVAASASDGSTVGIAAGVSAAALVVVCVAAVAAYLGRGKSRDLSAAPRASPFAIVFTDIQASTMLWATDAEAMGPALDLHHQLIRGVIAKHKAYEVKTVGDAFMIAVQDPQAAVLLAGDIQTTLHTADWGTLAIDLAYQEHVNAFERASTRSSVVSRHNKEPLFRGLRVRVGVHYGSGDVKFDEVALAYDYYGGVVNAASRVEAVGHGGQTIVSRAVMDALPSGFMDANALVSVPLGHHELRGLDELFELFQVMPASLSRRTFPELRLGDGTNKCAAPDAAASESRDGLSSKESGAATTAAQQMIHQVILALLSPVQREPRRRMLTALLTAWRLEDSVAGVEQLAHRLAGVVKVHRSQSSRNSSARESVSSFKSSHSIGRRMLHNAATAGGLHQGSPTEDRYVVPHEVTE